MDFAAAMDEVADQLRTIPELHVFAYPPDNLQPDAAVLDLPETYTYDETMRRGVDRIALPLAVLVSKVSDRAARGAIAPYFAGAGPRSIKAVVEAGTYTAFDTVRVAAADDPFQIWTVAQVTYLAGIFSLDIAGPGDPQGGA